MSSFIAAGFDGYVDMRDAEIVVGEEGAMTDTGLLLDVLGYDKSGATNESSRMENQGGSKKSATEQVDGGGDTTNAGIARARAAIIWRYDSVDGLPIVNPVSDGRITFREGSMGGAETPHL